MLKYNVQQLLTEFNSLNDATEMSSPTAVSSDATRVSIVSTDGSANAGISEIGVSALAASQRNKSNQYSSATQSINSGAGFTLTLTPGSGTATNVTVAAGNDTPQGIVAAINSANTGVTATLLSENSAGSNYRIILEGDTGASNTFVVTSTLPDSDLGFTTLATATLLLALVLSHCKIQRMLPSPITVYLLRDQVIHSLTLYRA